MMFTVIKRDHNGEKVLDYRGDVLERGDTWVCVRATFQIEQADLGLVVFRRGDIFTEWFYSDRWYNIFKVQAADSGQLKGWYCNLTRPAVIGDAQVSADDLAMDVFVNPAGVPFILDMDEFAALELTDSEQQSALKALDNILEAVAGRIPPFDEIQS